MVLSQIPTISQHGLRLGSKVKPNFERCSDGMSTKNVPLEIQEGLLDVVVDESGIRMSNLSGSPESGLSATVRTFGCLYNGAFKGVTKEASVQNLIKLSGSI
jgi:hypothetical protein